MAQKQLNELLCSKVTKSRQQGINSVTSSRKVKTVPPSIVKKDKQKHSGSVAMIFVKTDRSIVSPTDGSHLELQTAKSQINNENKQSVVSAFESNNDTTEQLKIEPVTPVDVKDINSAMNDLNNQERERLKQVKSPKLHLIRSTLSRHSQLQTPNQLNLSMKNTLTKYQTHGANAPTTPKANLRKVHEVSLNIRKADTEFQN